MKKLTFRVTFLSDIVLPATSNTEGNIEPLDFIPGSNFLGMVAKNYDQFTNAFEVFHSGAVRFGDATLEVAGKPTYKVPLSFMHKKLDDSIFYNSHYVAEMNKDEREKLGQLKQKREGYITDDLHINYPNYTYAQKSAYDTTNRTSKDGSMYGYKAIVSGTSWLFDVTVKEGIDVSEIQKILESSTQLGKSKSAQYGKIKIECLNVSEVHPNVSGPLQNVILYVKSRLALIDADGHPTLDLRYLCDGLDTNAIDLSKTQIRTTSFTPYNGARQTKDYERVCINKGSVIFINELTAQQVTQIQSGIGAFLSDGFGEVLLNPSFLMQKEFTLKSSPQTDPKNKQANLTTPLGKFLNSRHAHLKERLDIAKNVDTWAEDHKSLFRNIKPSQWGNIRALCTGSPDDYHTQIIDYISSGTKKWDPKQVETFKKAMQSRTFTKLLSIKMGKIAQKKGEKDAN